MVPVELLSPAEAVPSNPEWHRLRRAGISASEIAAVLGLSPWQSPFGLYWAKREDWEIEGSDEMTAGRYAEPAVAEWFADNCDPHENLVIERAGLYAHPDRPWQLATPDRLISEACGCCGGTGGGCPCGGPPSALLECKYVVSGWDGWGEPGTDDVPVYYRAQCLWQADVMGVDEVYLAAWHAAEFRCYTIRRDEKDLRVMRAAAQQFLRRLDADDPPPLDDHSATLATLKRLHPDLDDRDQDLTEVLDPAAAAQLAAGWLRANALKKRAESLIDRYDARLRAAMGDARRAVHNGRTIATRVISDVAESTVTRAAHRRDYLLPPRKKAS